LCGIVAVVGVGACDKHADVHGQLMVTFQTDMAMPEQIDNVHVQVTVRGGRVQLMRDYPVGPAHLDYRIPGTLALLAGNDPSEPVTITVAGSKANKWRTYREITTTVPPDRVAELRMPVQWLCNESAMPQAVSMPDGSGGIVTHIVGNCDEGTTCKAGKCVPNSVDSKSLPDYAAEHVFGGASDAQQGSCFDTIACMAPGRVVTPDADCTVAKPNAEAINVGLRVADGGICETTTGADTMCFVPLDGKSDEGWTLTANGARLQLPSAVCKRIEQRKVLAVYMSTSCPTKRENLPACGHWSSVPSDHAVTPPAVHAKDSAGTTSVWPSPELIASLLPEGSSVCCALMSDQNKLYSCGCAAGDANKATLYALDPHAPSPKGLALMRTPTLASVLVGDTMYWAEKAAIYSQTLSATTTAPASFSAQGAVYYQGMMLSDNAGLYLLTNGVADTATNMAQPVQLLRFGYDGKLSSMDPLGNSVVLQFAQDDGAFYAGLNLDELVADGQPFMRISSVVRIDKPNHRRSTVLSERTVAAIDKGYNGYLGVVSDGSTLFALFETAPGSDAKEHLQIQRVEQAASTQPSNPEPIFDLPVAARPHYTTLHLLGAVDGAVLFAREEWETNLQVLRSASVMAIPKGTTTAHFVADFVADRPTSGLVVKKDEIYWLNESGRVFGLDRSALMLEP
jgi:hypothetical protein